MMAWFLLGMLHLSSSLTLRGGRLFRPSLLNAVSNLRMSSVSDSQEKLYEERLQKLRKTMHEKNIGVFIVPTDDPHMSEYTAEHYNRREFISGFTGSAGVAVVTDNNAYLFTDGRYFKQAEMELPKSWTLMKVGLKGVPNWFDFVTKSLPDISTAVGIDPFVHPAETVRRLQSQLSVRPSPVTVALLEKNPIDKIWGKDRPQKPCTPLRLHPLQYAGKTTAEKLTEVRNEMAERQVDGKTVVSSLVIASLDEIMWLFNVRGSDVLCNPVSISYAVVTPDRAYLFIDTEKVDGDMRNYLTEQGVEILPYDSILVFLRRHVSTLAETQKVWFDAKTTNAALAQVVPETSRLEKDSPVVLLKALKNAAELEGMRQCHLRDGAAFAEFLAWLEDEVVVQGNESITEVDIDTHLTASRAAFGPFFEPSFATIAGVNSNGAIVHYRAVPGTCKTLTKRDMLLLDSGGQYIDGTTDVTRTFHFGVPTAHQMNMYTRVLQGHIALDRMVFPSNTPGYLLDSFARAALWRSGHDYNHGTGHGVGAALNVHERPQSISPRVIDQPLLPGMVVSNEPGYYDDVAGFGIRIENLLVVTPRTELGEYNGKSFFGFERLTHIPIQTTCLDLTLMSREEIEWLNEYHAQVLRKVMPLLRTERARDWLRRATKPLVPKESLH